MKNGKIFEENEVKVKEQVYSYGKSDALEIIVTDKRIYIDLQKGGDEESHIAQIKDVNDVSLSIKRIQKTRVLAAIFASIFIIASIVMFILSPMNELFMPIAIGLAVAGGILAILFFISLIPKYSIVMDIVVSGYPITANIGISNVDSARQLQKAILLQAQKANEPAPVVVQVQEKSEPNEPEVNAL